MSSETSICNLALSYLGKNNIEDLSDAGTEARACRQFYAHNRDTLLQAYPWRSAGKTISLAELTNDRPGQWAYCYQRPTDCLKIRWVRREFSLTDACPQTLQQEIMNPFDWEGTKIYCNLSPAFLRYTFKLTDPTKFSPLLIDAMAQHLAVRLAMPLTRDPKVRADAYALALEMQARAQEADANEVRETTDVDSELIEVRA